SVLFWCWQPATGSHESSVQTLLSSQLSAVPGLQKPNSQNSWPLQTVASSHGLRLSKCTQPAGASTKWKPKMSMLISTGLQESSVHTLPSLQSSGGPPSHWPFAQVSLVVQALPSLHGLVLLSCWQPRTGSHESL